jgi:hypothetical protein
MVQPLSVAGSPKGEPDKIQVPDFAIRNGLPNFFAKAMNGDSLRVAYFGGSITAQNGWRVASLDWLKVRFPKAIFTEINAAIGGTGSDFGVFRLKDHVLKFKYGKSCRPLWHPLRQLRL